MTQIERIAPEQYDSLPGIPEPSENPLLVRHAPKLHRLLASLTTGKMHHALLLHGPRGIGKATFAFHLARHALAAGTPSAALFRQVAMGAHPGLLHLTRPLDRDGKKFRTAITVDEVRRIGNLLSHTSHDDGFRVVIVDPADDMNVSAANALLKNLEEPPANCLFILISHRPGGLLPTIRSRCHAVRLQPLAESEIDEVLRGVGAALPDDAASRTDLIARAAGSPRNAILMAEYGGLDLAAALDEILRSSPLDIDKAHRLGDAVAGRGSEVRFAILNGRILDLIAEQARKAAEGRDIERASRLAGLWQSTQDNIRATETYNLDRKQQVVAALLQLREAFA